MKRSGRWSACLAAMLAVVAACRSSPVDLVVDRCFILVAQVNPADPFLQLGDTVTMRATFSDAAPDCLPPDTTAAGLRWISNDPAIVAVDPAQGRLTALRPGVTQIMLMPAGEFRVLGTTFANVLEPPSADSLISLVQNNAADSASIVLEDANGAIVRQVTLAAGSSTCWNTAVSDSVHYSAQVYFPGQPSATLIGAKWVVHAGLAVTHTWRVTIDPQTSAMPTLDLAGLSPDRGC